jgi:chromosome segregation ATPase
MNSKLDKIDAKLDKIDERLGSIDVTLAKQEVNLKEHMRRTHLNEVSIAKIKDDIVPINKHINMLEGVLKFFGVISLLVGIVAAVVKVIEFF